MKRILVTGPVEHLLEYKDAAAQAGWQPIDLPLLSVQSRPFESAAVPERRYDWICITSASSLPFLEAALARRPALCEVPAAVVGPRTAERVIALGLRLEFEPAPHSESLAVALLARARAGNSVLWPRGELSDDLARRLRAGGMEVEDPIAYSTRPIERAEPPPSAEAVFFASPSAVRAWHQWCGEPGSRTAIAIGPSTFEALALETGDTFFDTISLPLPTPEAFGFVLAHLDLPTSP